LFSTRTVCRTCRKAIMTAQSKISHAAFMAFDFKVDRDGNLGNYVYPIRQDPNAPQEPIDYTV
jgi:hypothetical protein